MKPATSHRTQPRKVKETTLRHAWLAGLGVIAVALRLSRGTHA